MAEPSRPRSTPAASAPRDSAIFSITDAEWPECAERLRGRTDEFSVRPPSVLP